MASSNSIDHFLSLGGSDVSDYLQSVTLDYGAELLDETAMGDTTRKNLGGLKNWSVTAEFKQSFTDNELDEILFALVGTTFTVIVRPTSSVVGTSNPNYTGTCIMDKYSPIGNGVGALAKASITLQSAGALSRAVA